MVSWILVGVLAVIAIIIFIKFKEIGHKTKFMALLFALIILLGTVGYVYMQSHADLSYYEGFRSLGKAYFAWAGGLLKNMGTISGYAVKQDWGINGTSG